MNLYEKISEWLKEKENKDKVVIAVSFILIFVVGFGAGRYERGAARAAYKPQTNYTTKPAGKPATATPPGVTALGEGVVAGAATSTPSAICVIKGNISSAGKKIYHVQGGAFYARVKPEECFNTEAEAQAAGFIKSSR